VLAEMAVLVAVVVLLVPTQQPEAQETRPLFRPRKAAMEVPQTLVALHLGVEVAEVHLLLERLAEILEMVVVGTERHRLLLAHP
jgi:hypothetical protein